MTARAYLMAQEAFVPFVVGIWGQEDAILPFADFDGDRWRSSWPTAVEARPDVRPIERIPAAWWGRSRFEPHWELLEPTGRRRAVRIVGTTEAGLGSSCAINVALDTDVPPNAYEYGSVLAASRAGVIEHVVRLAASTSDWRTVAAALPTLYTRHEANAWKEVSEDFRPDLSSPVSRPILDAAFAFTDDAGEFVYFESHREFARRRDQLGDERSFISGWLRRRSATSSFQSVDVVAQTRDPDGKGAVSFEPLGVVKNGARRFWLGVVGSYAYSGMMVTEVRRAGVKEILVVDYPGC